MLFERISIERPGAYARGWIADREGIFHDSRRGYGGQARTVDRLFAEGLPALAGVDRLGWVTSLKASRRGTGSLALQSLIERFAAEHVDAIGLIALPDDDAFLERLINYYRRHGFEIIADYDAYPVMLLRRPPT